MSKVLIINDRPSEEFFTTGFSQLGCQVTACKSEKALDLFLEENYNYILVVMEKNKQVNPDIFSIYEIIKASISKDQKLLVTGWLENNDDDYIRLPAIPKDILKKFEA